MQIHNLPAQTTAANADVLAIDNGTTTQKITAANLGKKVTEDATPAFTSNDSTTATAWTNVAVLASAETMKSILNKISTMFKNIRYLYGAVTQLNTDKVSVVPAGSTLLASGQNLHDLAAGNYYSNSRSLTETLVNVPAYVLTAFRLQVVDIGYASSANPYRVLILTANIGLFFKRLDGNNVWSDWKRFADPDVDLVLNTGTVTWNTTNVTGNANRRNWFKFGRVVIASLEFTPISGKIENANVICTGLPTPYGGDNIYVYGENGQQMSMLSNGSLTWYFPSDTTTTRRIDITIVYIEAV